MMIVFFDLEGIVGAGFVPRNTTVNSEYYKGLLLTMDRNCSSYVRRVSTYRADWRLICVLRRNLMYLYHRLLVLS